jgi:hypothetical protein
LSSSEEYTKVIPVVDTRELLSGIGSGSAVVFENISLLKASTPLSLAGAVPVAVAFPRKGFNMVVAGATPVTEGRPEELRRSGTRAT